MRSILAAFGSNLLLCDKRLVIVKGKALSAVEDVSFAVQAANSRLEPQSTATNKDILQNSAIKNGLLRLLYFARTERFDMELAPLRRDG
jgi:hypothetical protein